MDQSGIWKQKKSLLGKYPHLISFNHLMSSRDVSAFQTIKRSRRYGLETHKDTDEFQLTPALRLQVAERPGQVLCCGGFDSIKQQQAALG